ncbi:MAG: hypothetical protein EXS46_00250 [Candidatus Taylorbacteria bacterium]|nr:hypothetical protein [Candidatus Taylorbacteria bacterium]
MRSFSVKQVAATIIVITAIGVAAFYLVVGTKKIPTEVKESILAKVSGSIIKTLGNSLEGRKIQSYTYGTGKTNLLFVGGIHGGYEWNSVVLAYTFIDYLDEHPEVVPENLTITVIPSLNPDGLHKVGGKEGRFEISDVSTDKAVLASGRFNAREVDLNRNFDCKWQPKSTWQSKTVSAGTAPFSEPEAVILKKIVLENKYSAVVFWHSQSNGVYASQCEKGILPGTLDVMNIYSKASGYPAVKTFDAYVTTGAAEDWLASINIPAVTVELKTHETIEWDKNLAGIKALMGSFQK